MISKKNPSYSHPNHHFRLDQKRAKRTQKSEEHTAKPVPKPNPMFRNQIAGNVLEIALGGFCGLQTTPFHLEAIKSRKELERIRKTKVMGNCGTCNFHKLWEIAEHAMNRELR